MTSEEMFNELHHLRLYLEKQTEYCDAFKHTGTGNSSDYARLNMENKVLKLEIRMMKIGLL